MPNRGPARKPLVGGRRLGSRRFLEVRAFLRRGRFPGRLRRTQIVLAQTIKVGVITVPAIVSARVPPISRLWIAAMISVRRSANNSLAFRSRRMPPWRMMRCKVANAIISPGSR